MSACERDSFTLVKRLFQVGAGFAFIAAWRYLGCLRASYTIDAIRDAPCVDVSSLRSLLLQKRDDSSGRIFGGGELLAVVRGTVDALVVEEVRIKPVLWGWINSAIKRFLNWLALKGSWLEWALDRGWMDLPRNGLLSSSSGENGVIVQKTQSRFFVRSIFSAGGWREMRSFTRSVPFVLKQGDQQSQSDYLTVNVGKSKHPLPLITVHYQKQTINAAPYTFLQALFRRSAVALLDEEKVLSPGKEITAVGVCCLKDGLLEIKSCKNLPCFLSEMSKDEIIKHLSVKREGLMWSSIVVGSISFIILGYAMYRVWNIWEGEQQEQGEQDEAREVEALVEQVEEDHVHIDYAMSRVWNTWEREQMEQGEEGEVCEVEASVEQGEKDQVREEDLCVTCLTRRREFAFVPCGHMVCCKRCVTSIVSVMNPKCPICRHSITRWIKIYAS